MHIQIFIISEIILELTLHNYAVKDELCTLYSNFGTSS